MRVNSAVKTVLMGAASSISSDEWVDVGRDHPEFDSEEIIEHVDLSIGTENAQSLGTQERISEWLNIVRKEAPKVTAANDLQDTTATQQPQEDQLRTIADALVEHLHTDTAQFHACLAPHLTFNKFDNATHMTALHDLALRLRGTPYWMERDRIAYLTWRLSPNKSVQLFNKKELIQLLPEDEIFLMNCKESCPLSLTEHPTKLFARVIESPLAHEKKSRVSPETIIGQWIDDFLNEEVKKNHHQRLALLAIPASDGKMLTPMALIRDIFRLMFTSEGLSPKFISGLTSAEMNDEETKLIMPNMSSSQHTLLKEWMQHVELTSGKKASLFPNAVFGTSTAEKLRNRLTRVGI